MRVTTRQIAKVLQCTKRTVQRRTQREGWPYSLESGLGGQRKVYEFDALPPLIQESFINYYCDLFNPSVAVMLPTSDDEDDTTKATDDELETRQATENSFSNHPFAQINPPLSAHFTDDKTAMRAGLLSLALAYVAQQNMGKVKGFDCFCQIYNAHKFALQPCVYGAIKRISRITLLRWQKVLDITDTAKTFVPIKKTPTFAQQLQIALTRKGQVVSDDTVKAFIAKLQTNGFTTDCATKTQKETQ